MRRAVAGFQTQLSVGKQLLATKLGNKHEKPAISRSASNLAIPEQKDEDVSPAPEQKADPPRGPPATLRRLPELDVTAWFEGLMKDNDWNPAEQATKLHDQLLQYRQRTASLTIEKQKLLTVFPFLHNDLEEALSERELQPASCAFCLQEKFLSLFSSASSSSSSLTKALLVANTKDLLTVFQVLNAADREKLDQATQVVRAQFNALIVDPAKSADLTKFFKQATVSPALAAHVRKCVDLALNTEILSAHDDLILPMPKSDLLQRLSHIRVLALLVQRHAELSELEVKLKKRLDFFFAQYNRAIANKEDEKRYEDILRPFLSQYPEFELPINVRLQEQQKIRAEWALYMDAIRNKKYSSPVPVFSKIEQLSTSSFTPAHAMFSLVELTGEVFTSLPPLDLSSFETPLGVDSSTVFDSSRELHSFCRHLLELCGKQDVLKKKITNIIEKLEGPCVTTLIVLHASVQTLLSKYKINESKSQREEVLVAVADRLRQARLVEAPLYDTSKHKSGTIEAACMTLVTQLHLEHITELETRVFVPRETALFLMKLFRWTETIDSKLLCAHVFCEIEVLLRRVPHIVAIGASLQDDPDEGEKKDRVGSTGLKIIQKFTVFERARNELFAKQTGSVKEDDALEALCNKNNFSPARRVELFEAYHSYNREYLNYVKLLWKSPSAPMSLRDFSGLNMLDPEQVPRYLGRIAAVFSLLKSGRITDEALFCQFRPHPMQVLSIFCMLLKPASTLNRHILEVGTGEGKSIILGLLATYLALAGFNVDVVCYSKLLVNRDELSFQAIFDYFEIRHKIHYGTFDQIVEEFISSVGNIRKLTHDLLDPPETKDQEKAGRRRGMKDRILLIDEVDVFMQESFYGGVFSPIVNIFNEQIIDFLFENPRASMSDLKKHWCYQTSLAKFPSAHLREFLGKQAQVLQRNADSWRATSWSTVTLPDGKCTIAYPDGAGGLSQHMRYLGISPFHFWAEHKTGNLSETTREANIGFSFPVGSYSYAEIPEQYAGIFGVTATFEILGSYEKKVLEKHFNITHSLTSSIYGPSKLKGLNRAEWSASEREHFIRIRDKVKMIRGEHIKGVSAPILLFFADDLRLKEFVNHSEIKPWLSPLLQERVAYQIHSAEENFEYWIGKSMEPGKITLLPAVFGRGQDFKCYEDIVDDLGGVHVIQTFLSPNVSEEVQIRGRTARQGHKGMYMLFVSAPDLKRVFDFSQNLAGRDDVYAILDAKRRESYTSGAADRDKRVKEAKKLHDKTWRYLQKLVNKQISVDQAVDFLTEVGDLGLFSFTIRPLLSRS